MSGFSSSSNFSEYMSQTNVSHLLESLLSALMIDRPDNPIEYLLERLREIKRMKDTSRADFQTFVKSKHPYRDPLRLQLICDNSIYQKEPPSEGIDEESEGIGEPDKDNDPFFITENSDGLESSTCQECHNEILYESPQEDLNNSVKDSGLCPKCQAVWTAK